MIGGKQEDIKGLTPKEIQAKFALEYEPKFIGEVRLKAGGTVRLGEVDVNLDLMVVEYK